MAPRAKPLHVAELGRGRPLVLVHGWATSGRVLLGLAGSLSGVARVVLPDLRGHGSSPPPEGPFSIDDHGADVARLVRELGGEPPLLAGWSLGALVALAASARLEADGVAVAGLALLAPTARFTSGEGHPHGLPPSEVEGLKARMRRNPAKALARFFAACLAEGELPDAERGRALALLAAEPPDAEGALAALDALAAGDLREVASRLRAPALLLHGERDAIVPPGASEALARTLPRARRRTFPGVGHAPFLSRPSEVAAALREFAAAPVDGVAA